MEFTQFVGLITLLLNAFLQISPIPGMIEGFRKNEIKSMTIGYFMTGITQSCFWLGYGVCLKDFFVYFPNIPFITLFTIYLNMLIYVKKEYRYFFILNCSIIFELIFILSFLPEIVCVSSASIISLVWQTTNTETMRLALKYHSKDYINPQVSFVSFICFSFNSLYSLLIHAYIMMIPNLYGALMNLTNIFLYFWARGYFANDNAIVHLLTAILKPEKLRDDNNLKPNIDNIDKEKFLNNI